MNQTAKVYFVLLTLCYTGVTLFSKSVEGHWLILYPSLSAQTAHCLVIESTVLLIPQRAAILHSHLLLSYTDYLYDCTYLFHYIESPKSYSAKVNEMCETVIPCWFAAILHLYANMPDTKGLYVWHWKYFHLISAIGCNELPEMKICLNRFNLKAWRDWMTWTNQTDWPWEVLHCKNGTHLAPCGLLSDIDNVIRKVHKEFITL